MSNQGETNDKLGTDTVRDTLKKESAPTPQEVFEFFQTGCHMVNKHDDTEGESSAYSMPKVNIEVSPCKTYTKEEIKEYESQRDWIEELDNVN